CSRPGPPVDDGGVDAPPDALREGGALHCQLNAICAGNTVRTCESEGSGAIVETCDSDQPCSRGPCTSPACAAIEEEEGVAGCLFYTVQVESVDSDNQQQTTILAAYPGLLPATIRLERRAPGQPWVAEQTITATPGGAGRFAVPARHLAGA